jgi:hypothetical protein
MTAHIPPGGWVPNAAALIQQRPELAGIGLTNVLEAVTAA